MANGSSWKALVFHMRNSKEFHLREKKKMKKYNVTMIAAEVLSQRFQCSHLFLYYTLSYAESLFFSIPYLNLLYLSDLAMPSHCLHICYYIGRLENSIAGVAKS